MFDVSDEQQRQINNILQDMSNQYFNSGLARGLGSVERILTWVKFNHKLAEPKTTQEIAVWIEEEAAKLRELQR